jgi:predicted TIM-barrel fold metal-dependent hydrolase
MAALDYQAFDADNHYYEAEDAFTRHVDPKMHKRCMQWADINGRKRLLVGGKVNRFIPNPTFDPVARPGCLDDYFRGKVAKDNIVAAFGELVPIPDEYRDRDKRLEVMDRQNLESCFMFPTLGVGMESSLEHDVEAMLTAFDGFNKWVEDDWGLNYKDRIFTAGYITLADVDWALDQLDWMIERDVRVVNMRPSSVPDGNGGRRSLGHPAHDPFWKKMNQHGITLAMHSGDSGYEFMSDYWGMTDSFEAFRQNAFKSLLTYSPISDALASLIAENVLSEHTNIRVATIETGSEWVQPLVKKFEKTYKQQKHMFAEDPMEVFRRQVYVSPYYEDDLLDLKDKIGAEHMLFGSDWPHAEGLPEPTDFIDDLHEFTSAETEMIMRTNGLALTKRAV